jgi:hypothetical protein
VGFAWSLAHASGSWRLRGTISYGVRTA